MSQWRVFISPSSSGYKMWAKAHSSDCVWGSLVPLKGVQFGSTKAQVGDKTAKGYTCVGRYSENFVFWLCKKSSAALPDNEFFSFLNDLKRHGLPSCYISDIKAQALAQGRNLINTSTISAKPSAEKVHLQNMPLPQVASSTEVSRFPWNW